MCRAERLPHDRARRVLLEGEPKSRRTGRFASKDAAGEAAGATGPQAFKQALPSDTDAATRRTAAGIGREALSFLHGKAASLAGKVSSAIRGTQLVSLAPTHAGGVEIHTRHPMGQGSVESRIQLHERDVDGDKAKAAIRAVHGGLRAIGVPPTPATFSGDIRCTR